MKNFQVHILSLAILLALTQKSSANSIAETCKQTPNYNLCVNSLSQDPRSAKADVTGLALIMVDITKTRLTKALQFTKHLKGERPQLKKPLSSCADIYDFILKTEIPMAIQALKLGDPKFGEGGLNDAAIEIDECEDGFHGKSPLSKFNKLVHDTSLVASAIIRLLL